MSRNLARNLYHLMRRASRRTPIDSLKRKGHRTVSVLNFRDVQQIIARAIDNTLKRRGLRLDGPDVHEEVRLEFLALMRERDLLQQTVDELLREKDELRENKVALESELSRTTLEYQSEVHAVSEPEEVADLTELQTNLAAQLRGMLGNEEAGERAIALVSQAIEEQRLAALDKAREGHEVRMSQLQRRIAKLKNKLEETEEMLVRARSEGGPEAISGEPLEPGLTVGDPNYETKKELLGEIFRLNVELRSMLKQN